MRPSSSRSAPGKRCETTSRRLICSLFVFSGLFAVVGHAQWVDFGDETVDRLRIRAFADGSGPPLFDDQEKDIATGDLNGDGWTDVVVVRKEPFSNEGPRQDVLLLNQQGRLRDVTALWAPGFLETPTDARDVLIADFTGDGWPDVVIANTFGQQPSFYRNAGLDLEGRWLGLVDESSQRFPEILVPDDVITLQFCAVTAGDVDDNGALDLYFANYREQFGTTDVLLMNDGTGHFVNESDSRLGDRANVAFGTSAEIHDVDADGDLDIVKMSAKYIAFPFFDGTYVLFNDGTGRFDTVEVQRLDANLPYMFTVADFNQDGLLDHYVVTDLEDRILIARDVVSDGPVDYATRPAAASPRTADVGGNTKVADVDGDGDLDIGIAPIDVDRANCGGAEVFALLENTGADLVDPWPLAQPAAIHIDPHDFAFLDLDRDGCTDLFMGLCQGWRVFMQSCQ